MRVHRNGIDMLKDQLHVGKDDLRVERILNDDGTMMEDGWTLGIGIRSGIFTGPWRQMQLRVDKPLTLRGAMKLKDDAIRKGVLNMRYWKDVT